MSLYEQGQSAIPKVTEGDLALLALQKDCGLNAAQMGKVAKSVSLFNCYFTVILLLFYDYFTVIQVAQ